MAGSSSTARSSRRTANGRSSALRVALATCAEVPRGDDVVTPLEEAEEEDEELLEDASELGEDEDDMAEVIENVEEEER